MPDIMQDIELQPFHTPTGIEQESFAIIDKEIGNSKKFTGYAWEIARRLIHTCADFDILNNLSIPDQSIAAGIHALSTGCSIITDTRMALAGIPARRLTKLNCSAHSFFDLTDDEKITAWAKENESTKTFASIKLAQEKLNNSVICIGNAPTALLALLECITPQNMPALVIAMPVGFVNAAESKTLFWQKKICPTITLCGRKGGSPLAAATINALAEIVLRQKGL